MISRLFLASGSVVALNTDAGALQTIKTVVLILFLVIGAVWLLVDIRRNLIATYSVSPPQSPLGPIPVSTPVVRASSERPTPEVLAVIAAAVHTTLGRASRIVAISSDDDDAQSWAAEGRRAIYATRKVR
ncbi:MAG: hypothetical protein IPL39_21980 [Opitutaceae bacterium]|nr:hypothetical protein [Opitutaceae bacterium]